MNADSFIWCPVMVEVLKEHMRSATIVEHAMRAVKDFAYRNDANQRELAAAGVCEGT